MIAYCPKCHKEAYRIEENGDNIKIIQGGRTVLNLGHSSNVSMSLTCPSGHPVKLEIESKEEKEEEKDGSAQHREPTRVTGED